MNPTPLDLEFVRSRFPALATDWALMDNAGGSVPADAVRHRVHDFLTRLSVQLHDSARADAPGRVPTISFVVAGLPSGEVVRRLDQHRIATRFGHFYAYRPAGVLDGQGWVRVSLAHYNCPDEVERLLGALEEVLPV